MSAASTLPRSPTRTRLRRWVLLDGDRNVLAAGIVLVGVLVFAWLGYRRVLDIGRSTTPMLYLFSALVGGNITLMTIVITISQLVLSRELRSPRELQLELESAEDFRDAVEEETSGAGISEHPAEFLRVLVASTHRQATDLASTSDQTPDPDLRDDLSELTSGLRQELEETRTRLEASHGGVFTALSTILDADFSARLNHSRWIRRANEDDLSEAQTALLEDLERRIEQLDVARQYFKTIHIMQELADTSRLVTYSGLVATLVALAFIVVTGYARTPVSPLTRLVLVPAAVGVGLVPLSLLATHVLRITTVARRTAAITPFLSPGE